MRNVRLVIGHEFRTTVTRLRFWISTFIFPAVVLFLSMGSQVAMESAIETEVARQTTAPVQTQGYVDLAGVVRALPPQVPAGAYLAYPSEADAAAALQAGQIARYYVVPADWLATGAVSVVEAKFAVTLEQPVDPFQLVLNYNLTDDANLATYLTYGPSVEGYALAPDAAPGRGDTFEAVPYTIMMLFFFVLTMSSTMMLQSVSKEKENRTAEVLLTSLRPRELMLGKVIAQGALALLQMVIWLGGAYLITQQRPALLGITGAPQLSVGFFVWSLLYFVLGYLLFGSAMAALGALAPDIKQSSQFTFIVLVPLMIPLFFNPILMSEPNGPASVALSLFPLTSPIVMAVRMAATIVPVWQLLLGLALLAATAYGLVALAGRFFRADNLLSSGALDVQRLLRELRRAGKPSPARPTQ